MKWIYILQFWIKCLKYISEITKTGPTSSEFLLQVECHCTMATRRFNRLSPNTVSSEFTFTVTSNGCDKLPWVMAVIKHGFELFKSSPANLRHRSAMSSGLRETGMSIETRWKLLLLRIFTAKQWATTRFLSAFTELFSFCSSSWRWSLKVHLQ